MFRATARALGVAAGTLRRCVLLAALVLLIAVPSQVGFAIPTFDDGSDEPWLNRLEEYLRPGPSGPRVSAQSSVLRTIKINPSDRCPVYVGIAFDGRELLVSCLANNVVTRVSPADGRNLGSVTILGISPSEGIAGMSWDGNRRVLWVATAFARTQKIYSVELDSPSGRGFATQRFTRSATKTVVDGVAYDGSDDTLWLSTDLDPIMYHYTTDGRLLGTFSIITGNGYGAAGVVVASRGKLYINNYYHTIESINKDGTQRSAFINFGALRAEDMECDNTTFAPRKAVWGKVDYTLQLHAWEVPECAQGGLVPGGIVPPPPPTPTPTPAPPPPPPSLTIGPNPVPAGSSRTTISWNTNDGSQAQIFVSENGGPESLVADGAAGSGEYSYVFPGLTYDFRLYNGTERQSVLRSVRVTRAPASICETRPRVSVTTVPDGSGLEATVTATGTDNRLLGLRFDTPKNARISTADRTNAADGFTFAPPAGSVATTFSLQPVDSGAATVRLTVFDECGAWQTFVGRGSGG